MNIQDIIRKNIPPAVICLIAFTAGVSAGLLSYPLVKDDIIWILKNAFAGVLEGTTPQIILKILMRNMIAAQ